MKNIFLIFFFIAHLLFAQTVYEVQPDTKGNMIILSIANESTTDNAGSISIDVVKNPAHLEIKNCEVKLGELNKGEEREAQFIFDVKKIPAVLKDTLKFRIKAERGGSWEKEIILSYALPTEYKLEQNYPNPFNPATTIEFSLPIEGKYQIKIFNILGEVIKELANEEFEAGNHKVKFDSKGLASGIYFYSLSGAGIRIVKKMMLVK